MNVVVAPSMILKRGIFSHARSELRSKTCSAGFAWIFKGGSQRFQGQPASQAEAFRLKKQHDIFGAAATKSSLPDLCLRQERGRRLKNGEA